MADTGAPWNIPYVVGTDIVRDYPTDSLALANAIADGLDAAGNAGIGSNVVSAAKVDAFTTTATADITGLTVTITPSSATAKILVLVHCYVGGNGDTANDDPTVALLRGATVIHAGTSGGTAAGIGSLRSRESGASPKGHGMITAAVLDAPTTVSPVTYKLQAVVVGGVTMYVNQNSTNSRSGASSITAIEVAA